MKAPDGTAIDRTKEVILGECGINWDDDGSYDFDGTGTVPDWDSQETVTIAGQTVFFDEAGREWLQSQLIPEAADELPADQIKPWYVDRALRRVEIVNTVQALMERTTGKKLAVKDCQYLTRAVTLLLDRSEPE
ncbi:hypothetical protein [Mesorhizobium sp. M7A.F.Ca.MR.362.00.0.0]|uniref:hypothetical protein n=1 Tax=Mesorhizobium sp. M7A.F.Ca.MR.362.00.0.0 TaxID=2496779 RepID=UPI000FD39E2C|nr:hypothetical protein [Mesorhizobium sp. M7A.F.Ca.MR.362.00.0.0]RUU76131.1 hypothetical protein EOC06_28145 [Mesorhizobium sp. M7A.F.Ca.MR.362.00.0.0]RWN95393.1 MAG: hypothetical protein EOS05_11410 [Mesorhizobium sp.]